jgi:hypothetical protein
VGWYPIADKLAAELKTNYTNVGILMIKNLFSPLPFSSESGYGFYKGCIVTGYQLQRLFNIK